MEVYNITKELQRYFNHVPNNHCSKRSNHHCHIFLSEHQDEVNRDNACQSFRKKADTLPELQALLRFFLTIPCTKQRLRVFTEWLNKPKTIKTVIAIIYYITWIIISIYLYSFVLQYSSEYYPFEMQWYMERVLPSQQPTLAELLYHAHGLLQTNRTLFSYIDPSSGLLARHSIHLLVDPKDKDYEEALNLALAYTDSITDLGGNSVVLDAPDVTTTEAIHVVIGKIKKSWPNYYVPLYSPEMFNEVLAKKYYDPNLISKFEIPQFPPAQLRIENLSSLV